MSASVENTVTEQAAPKRRGRPPNPEKAAAKLAAQKAKEAKLELVETSVDTSGVIDDFDALREAAIVAMGDYASEASPNIVAEIKSKKSGSSTAHRVHPLSLFVKPGVNDREFATDTMRTRIIEFGNQLETEGVLTPFVVYIENERFHLISGETRLRSILHKYVFGSVTDPKSSKIGKVPVTVLTGVNDFERKLLVASYNNQQNFTQIELAKNIKEAYDLGELQGLGKMEILERIAKAHGKTVTFVYHHLNMMELPAEVIGLLRKHPIAVSVATSVWKKSKENTAETVSTLKKAIQKMESSGARKVMPKHIPGLSVVGGTDTGNDDNTPTTETTVTEPSAPKNRKVSDPVLSKGQEILLGVLRDASWTLNDGFVSIDTRTSAPAVEWKLEEFVTMAKALKLRIPSDIADLLDDDDGDGE